MSDIDFMKIRRLDGGLLLVFRELLRRKRATEVAAVLGLSSSAVSHALSRLRELFEDPLFIRRPHGLEPTRRAAALAPQIEALIEATDAILKTDARFDPARSKRRFVIAAPDFFIALVGARLCEQMQAVAPQASFAMNDLAGNAAFDALHRGEIDLAIGRFGAARSGFTVETFYQDRYCVVARRDHPRYRRSISLKRYYAAAHVFSYSPGEGGESEDAGRATKLTALAIVPRWLTVLAMVSTCDGIGTVPRLLAERYADTLNLRILDAPFVGDPVTVSLVRRAGRIDDGADWFIDQLRTAMA